MKLADILICRVVLPLAVLTFGFAATAFMFHLLDEPKWCEFHTRMAVGCGIATVFVITLSACALDVSDEGPGGGD